MDKTSNGAVQAALRMNLPLREQRKLLTALSQRYTFVANEGKLPFDLFVNPKVVRYITILRDPIALTLSQFAFGRHVGVISEDVSYGRYTQLQCLQKGGNRQMRVILGYTAATNQER